MACDPHNLVQPKWRMTTALTLPYAVRAGIKLRLVPVDLRDAQAFIFAHHRHNKPPHAWKFGVGLEIDGELVGVAVAARPSARALDDGRTIEVSRTCTDGTRNANSKLYGAIWRAARSLGYSRGITYTQAGESGVSLLAAGWQRVELLAARGDWAQSSVALRDLRDPPQGSLIEEPRRQTGGVDRWRWEVTA